jgi:hypothetical protein
MFKIYNTELEYFYHSYNSTKHNERCVEVSLAFDFLKRFKYESVIEIGAVVPYYCDNIIHTVYDIVDPYEKCIRTDLTKTNFSFDNLNVLSISTIEHIGNGDYGLEIDRNAGIIFLKKIINESKNYLITFPWGYNKLFDNQILENKINFTLVKRISEFEWIHDITNNIDDILYNYPYSNGNSVILITNIKYN